jgi:hypothetical protein
MDAHDAGSIDLRRRGDDFEVSRAAEAAPVTEQLAQAAAANAPAAAPTTGVRVGMGPRGVTGRGRSRAAAPPAGLLTVGVIDLAPSSAAATASAAESTESAPVAEGTTPAAAKRGARKRGGRKTAARAGAAAEQSTPAAGHETPATAAPAKARRSRAAAPARQPRARKTAAKPRGA